jgi:hypothetical protein
MPQVFSSGTVLLVKTALIAIAAATVFVVVLGTAWAPRDEVSVHAASAQPIPFSHKHHVGDLGLDCRFCHASVENEATPGMPSAQLCLGCHSQLFADEPLLAPLRQSVESNQPIAWAHLSRLPDYVYFDHSVHLAKGVACVECHGRVDQMPLMSRQNEMTMKWCVACHENPAPHLREPAQVFEMPPPTLTSAQHAAVAAHARLEPRQRLTDCSTCHR